MSSVAVATSHEVRRADPEVQTYAVVLYFDEETEDRLLRLWAALDVHGVDSAARTYGAGYRPHLTLSIIETAETDRLIDALESPLAEVAGLPVTLTSLGFFVPYPCPAYLAVTPTSRLLALHEEVYDALDMPCWDHYRPGSWMPHCTLAMRVDLASPVAHVVSKTPLPIHASVSAAHLVEIPKDGGVGRSAARFGGVDAQIPTQPVARHRAGPRHRRGRRLAPTIPLR